MNESYYADGRITLWHGRSEQVLTTLPDASVDAVVCDPPYGLEFMGNEWDSFKPSSARLRKRVDGRTNPTGGKSLTTTPEAYVAGVPFQRWCQAWATECLRVLKPGGHLLAFGGTRTVHRLTCGIEDAGFEIRDGIDWIYGQGFPKSMDVSKAIDRASGARRDPGVPGPYASRRPRDEVTAVSAYHDGVGDASSALVTTPATEEGRHWEGWGTALKPAREPIVVARKPLVGTVAANVLEHGTGAINIDACRVGVGGQLKWATPRGMGSEQSFADDAWTQAQGRPHAEAEASTVGRWPANVVLSHAATPDGVDLCDGECVPGCPVGELDEQSGTLTSGKGSVRRKSGSDAEGNTSSAYGAESRPSGSVMVSHGDTGGASRFYPVFRYQAKAPSRERPKVDGVAHSTVKPLALMRWLVRLVTPPGGLVLDPFAGSGTTVEACALEGFRCIAIEQDAQYLPLIEVRLKRSMPEATS